MKHLLFVAALLGCLCMTIPALAWDGFDADSADLVEVIPDRVPSKGDTVDNAIEWVNANSGDLEDCTVQELRDGLAAAGYTQQVADEAVTELLGNEALMALATPVKHLLG